MDKPRLTVAERTLYGRHADDIAAWGDVPRLPRQMHRPGQFIDLWVEPPPKPAPALVPLPLWAVLLGLALIVAAVVGVGQ